MSERQLQFRVGLLTIAASAIAIYLTFQFGEIDKLWQPTYAVQVMFPSAPGVYEGTPVKINGVAIGEVREVLLDAAGVLLVLDIQERYLVGADARIELARGLLGDTSLNVQPGSASGAVPPDEILAGVPYVDPMEIVQHMETAVGGALTAIESASAEWQRVGSNVNGLIGSRQGELEKIIVRTAESLHKFSLAMESFTESAYQANQILGDPANQENLRKTLESVPRMVDETRATIAAVRGAVGKAEENLANLASATAPLAKRSESMAIRLDATLVHVESLTEELSILAQLANDKNGTIRSLAEDASLYRNLNQSAETLSVLMGNLQPIMRDLRIFSDRIARHPEIMGVGGAISGSDGTKPISPANFEQAMPQTRGRVQ